MRNGRKVAAVGLAVGGMMVLGLGPVYGEPVDAAGESTGTTVSTDAPGATATTGTATAGEGDATGSTTTAVTGNGAAAEAAVPPVQRIAAATDPVTDLVDLVVVAAETVETAAEGEPGPPGDVPDPPGPPDEPGPPEDPPVDPPVEEEPPIEEPPVFEPPSEEDPGEVLCMIEPRLCDDYDPPSNPNPNPGGGNPGGGNPGGGGSGGGFDGSDGSFGGPTAEGALDTQVGDPGLDACSDPTLCSSTVLGAETTTGTLPVATAETSTDGTVLPETGSSEKDLPFSVIGGAMLAAGAWLMRRRPRLGGAHRA